MRTGFGRILIRTESRSDKNTIDKVARQSYLTALGDTAPLLGISLLGFFLSFQRGGLRINAQSLALYLFSPKDNNLGVLESTTKFYKTNQEQFLTNPIDPL